MDNKHVSRLIHQTDSSQGECAYRKAINDILQLNHARLLFGNALAFIDIGNHLFDQRSSGLQWFVVRMRIRCVAQ
jgi:hypothetical protein